MKLLVAASLLFAPAILAVPLVYNNNAWYTGQDPNLVGKREDYMIQSVTLDVVRDASGFTGEFQAVLRFNTGGPVPAVGPVATIPAYDFDFRDGIVTSLHAADLFFRESGQLRYGIPLVTHGGGGTINGREIGAGVFDSGDLYGIRNGVQTVTSNQFLPAGANTSLFGNGRTVWLESVSNVAPLKNGTTQIFYNGQCTANACATAEYTVTFNLSGTFVEGSEWARFLMGVADGSITPYFTGATCGNDLLDAAVPEPSTWALMACGVAVLVWRRHN
jgi:hypothetical protein